MFNLGGRQPRRTQGDESTRQPLLDEEDRNPVLFEAEGDEEEDEHALEQEDVEADDGPSRGRTVHFQEEVRVIGPPLRSTLASREAGKYTLLFLRETRD